MTYSLILACLWTVLAAILGMLPSNDNHWRRAYFLMTIGAPLLIWVFWENGIWFGLIVTFVALSVFRWPVRYFVAWMRRQVAG